MAKEKTFSQQTVRVPLELMDRIGHHLVDTRESFQQFVMRLVLSELDVSAGGQPTPAPEKHALLEGLSGDQQAIVKEFAELVRRPPADLKIMMREWSDFLAKIIQQRISEQQ